MAPTAVPLKDRFDKKWCPEPNSGCWLWMETYGWSGYGLISVRIPGRKHYSNAYAHRVSWKVYRGEIPGDLRVLHKCDNRACVNPDHLFLGTAQDNTLDMHRKGRAVIVRGYGTKRDLFKDEDIALAIEYRKLGWGCKRIAKAMGVNAGSLHYHYNHIRKMADVH